MTSEDWPIVRLGDFVEVIHGCAFKTKYADDEPSPYALFTRKNIAQGGGFREEACRYYHGDFDERFILEPGDLMLVLTDLSKDGDLLGLPAVVPRTSGIRYLHNQRVGKVVIRRSGIDRDFLYALFRSPDYRRHVLNTASQTTVRDTAPSRLHDYRFRLPPLSDQKRIARVISEVDDKIDSNRRLAGLLEEAAVTLFRARFFDFVGVNEFEESEIGRVPRGWHVVAFTEAVEINPRVPISKGKVVPYIEMAAVAPWQTRPNTVVERAYSGGARFEPGDTLMARITGCIEHGKGAFIDFLDVPGSGSTEFLVFRARLPLTPEGVFLLSRADRVRAHAIANMTGSSGRQRVQVAAFDDLKIAVPLDCESWRREADFTRSALRQSKGLWQESRTLRAVRDRLLPKLISGQIGVPHTADPAEVIEPAAEAMAATR